MFKLVQWFSSFEPQSSNWSPFSEQQQAAQFGADNLVLVPTTLQLLSLKFTKLKAVCLRADRSTPDFQFSNIFVHYWRIFIKHNKYFWKLVSLSSVLKKLHEKSCRVLSSVFHMCPWFVHQRRRSRGSNSVTNRKQPVGTALTANERYQRTSSESSGSRDRKLVKKLRAILY